MAPMSDPSELPPNSNRPNKDGTDPDLSRRRLLQGGLASAPVLMTLVSRPVLAQQCQSPSGFVSGNASIVNFQICTGSTPEFWKQEQSFGSWVAPYSPVNVGAVGGLSSRRATLFDTVFGGHSFPNQTLLDVLKNGGGPPYDVARYCVATLLNCMAGRIPTTVLTIPALKGLWNDYIKIGFFEPTSGVRWDHSQIVRYLLTTMPR